MAGTEKKKRSAKTRFLQFKRYEAFRMEQKAARAAAAGAPAMLAADKITAKAATATADAPAIPAEKRKTTTTRANRKITLAQFERYEAMLVKKQEEERGCHAVAGSPIFENCVKEGVILHQMQVKPSYASILKKGKKNAPPVRGYSLVAAALSRMKKQSEPPLKRATIDPRSCT